MNSVYGLVFLVCGTLSLSTNNWNLMYPDSIVVSSSNVKDDICLRNMGTERNYNSEIAGL